MNAKIAFYDVKCLCLKLSRQLKSILSKKQVHSYLFILSPPYCGSTLLNELLGTSSNVSSTNIFGTREGLGLPEVRKMIDYRQHWETAYAFPWKNIKKQWYKYWDSSKKVFLDKSQPALIRAQAMQAAFDGAYFILLVRNPFALCESYIRRDKMTALEAAIFTIQCFHAQKDNAATLKNVLILKYEQLVDTPISISQEMINFLPDIKELDTKRTFKAHNFKNKALPIINLNEEKLKKLKSEDLEIIQHYFLDHTALLYYFGYI